MRVRGFTQDECAYLLRGIAMKLTRPIRMVYDVYSTFGFEKIVVKLSRSS